MTDVRKKAKRIVALTSKSGKAIPVPDSLRGIMAKTSTDPVAMELEQCLAKLVNENRQTPEPSPSENSAPEPNASENPAPEPNASENPAPEPCASENPAPEPCAAPRKSSPKLVGSLLDATLPRPTITRMWSGVNWADYASATMDQKQLCGPLWYEGEICILFADTNVGKSLLAVQIADMVANGSYCATSLPELKPETLAQPVVYADFELSIAQFGRRYSAPHPDDETKKVYYDFSPRFNRVELFYDSDIENDTATFASKEFADQIINDLELHLDACCSRILIIDNITFMASGTETAADAMPLMKRLVALKKKRGMSILLLAHTPKRSLCNPLTRNDLQGSKMLINFADSAFAIGESNCGKDIRYIKQIKQRNCEQVYDSDNVLVCQLGKVYENFIGFRSIGTASEESHLAERRPEGGSAAAMRSDKIQRVRELRQQGMTPDQIASEIGVSRATAYRMVKNLEVA